VEVKAAEEPKAPEGKRQSTASRKSAVVSKGKSAVAKKRVSRSAAKKSKTSKGIKKAGGAKGKK